MDMTVTETQLEAAFDAWYRASVSVPVGFDSACPVDEYGKRAAAHLMALLRAIEHERSEGVARTKTAKDVAALLDDVYTVAPLGGFLHVIVDKSTVTDEDIAQVETDLELAPKTHDQTALRVQRAALRELKALPPAERERALRLFWDGDGTGDDL